MIPCQKFYTNQHNRPKLLKSSEIQYQNSDHPKIKIKL